MSLLKSLGKWLPINFKTKSFPRKQCALILFTFWVIIKIHLKRWSHEVRVALVWWRWHRIQLSLQRYLRRRPHHLTKCVAVWGFDLDCLLSLCSILAMSHSITPWNHLIHWWSRGLLLSYLWVATSCMMLLLLCLRNSPHLRRRRCGIWWSVPLMRARVRQLGSSGICSDTKTLHYI